MVIVACDYIQDRSVIIWHILNQDALGLSDLGDMITRENFRVVTTNLRPLAFFLRI